MNKYKGKYEEYDNKIRSKITLVKSKFSLLDQFIMRLTAQLVAVEVLIDSNDIIFILYYFNCI